MNVAGADRAAQAARRVCGRSAWTLRRRRARRVHLLADDVACKRRNVRLHTTLQELSPTRRPIAANHHRHVRITVVSLER